MAGSRMADSVPVREPRCGAVRFNPRYLAGRVGGPGLADGPASLRWWPTPVRRRPFRPRRRSCPAGSAPPGRTAGPARRGSGGAALWGSRGLPRRAGPAGQRGRRRRPSKATSTSSGRTSTVRASRPVSRAGNSAVCRASVRPIGPLKVLPGITRGPSPGSPAARASARPSDGPRRSHARPSRSTRDTGHRHGPAAPVTAATTWPRRSPAAPADDRAARVGPVPGLRPGALPTGARKSGGWRPPSRIGCRQP